MDPEPDLTPRQRLDREIAVVAATLFLLVYGGLVLLGLLR